MRLFLKNLLIIALFFLGFCMLAIYWDPFKSFKYHSEYYNNNYIEGNRENICYNLFERKVDKTDINSFIVGNSRSKAFKTSNWKSRLASSSYASQDKFNCFHFDGNGLGLYRAEKIIQFLDKEVKNIDNLLLVVDVDFFNEIEETSGHLYIEPPAISNKSKANFYLSFLMSSLDPSFLFSNLVFGLTNRYFSFMENHIIKSKYFHTSINETADTYYGYDKEIKIDSLGYYDRLNAKKIFYDRKDIMEISNQRIHQEQKKIILNIARILNENNTNIKIVISPLYNQIEFNKIDLSYLKTIFGSENVYDFSGKNKFTNSISNFYESSHYKTYVANEIMDEVYR